MTRTTIDRIAPRVVALVLAVASTATAVSAKHAAMVFNGIVRHVSENNIKVYDPATKQTLGFAIAPKFKQVFTPEKQTTQIAKIKPGQYVKVYYDRKLLGLAHADRIYLLNQNNAPVGKQ